MTTNTNTYDPLIDREDPEAMANSAEQQWNQIHYLLGLPDLNTLPGSQRIVGQRISTLIDGVRGGININQLTDQLVLEHNVDFGESQALLNMDHSGRLNAYARNPNIVQADAWLKVIYRHVTEADLRQILENIRGNLIRVDGTASPADWGNTTLASGLALSVDLNHPAWRTGDVNAIRARLLNRPLIDAGVVIANPPPPAIGPFPAIPAVMTDALITEILATQNNVQFSADPTNPRGSVVIQSLSDAIARRAPVEQLFSGTTDARELALALSMIQRDPTTVMAMQQGAGGQEALNRKNVAENVSNLKTIQPIVLPTGMRPNSTAVDAQNAVNDITRAGTGARALLQTAIAAGHAEEVRFQTDSQALEAAVAQWNADEAARNEVITRNTQATQAHDRRMEVYAASLASLPIGRRPTAPPTPPTLSVVPAGTTKPTRTFGPALFTPPVLPGIFSAPITSADAARAKLSELEITERSLNAAIADFATRGAMLQGLIRLLAGMNIQGLDRLFPMLSAVCPGTPPTFVPGALPANFNFAAVAVEIERNIPSGLKSIDDYVKDVAATANNRIQGSEACWLVIRRGLENQGLRGKELEDTIGYMRARMQRTPESIRDLDGLGQSVYQIGPDANENMREDRQLLNEWNEKNASRSIRRGYRRHNSIAAYRQNLFNERNIGLPLNENVLVAQRPLSTLMHAYFRTKYLLDLPEDDPNHLPRTSDVVGFMQRLHRAILQRAQESFHKGSGMRGVSTEQLRALGMNVDLATLAAMSIAERTQAVHSFLLDGTAYNTRYKKDMDKMANRTNPIHEQRRSSERWATRRSMAAKVVTVPYGLTKQAMVVAGTSVLQNRKAIAAGALVGSILIPIPGIGTMIGAAAAPLLQSFFKPSPKT